MPDSDHIFVFFKPSAELTSEIIRQNQALVKESAGTVPHITSEFEEGEPLFDRFGIGYVRPRWAASKLPVESGQQLIAQRIYDYLSSLAESPWAREGGSFPVSEYFPSGMMTILGFSSLRRQPKTTREQEVRQLIERLTGEFVDWLANVQNGAFVTPWLEMHLTTEGELRLIAIPDVEELEDDLSQKLESLNEALDSIGKTAVASRSAYAQAESSTQGFHVAETLRREGAAVARAIEAGRKAYREERMKSEADSEPKTLTAEEEHT